MPLYAEGSPLTGTSVYSLARRTFVRVSTEYLTPGRNLRVDDDDVELNVFGCLVDILGTNCDQCLSMVQCCFTSTETVRVIRTGGPGRPPRLSHSS